MAKPPLVVRKIIRIGNSIGITVDRSILDRADLKPGEWVEVKPGRKRGTLEVTKVK
ncbi:MAG: hypothetical protein WD940_01800 [Patescibacteria group bacterium]